MYHLLYNIWVLAERVRSAKKFLAESLFNPGVPVYNKRRNDFHKRMGVSMTPQTYHVLLVDDYEINLDLLETYLLRSRLPIEIYKALNGRQALHIAETQALDLILLDVMLSDMNGYDICKQLKNDPKYQAIPIVMITALSDKDSLFEGLQSGADEFLTKPVDGHELTIRVHNLLKLRRLTTDLAARNQELEKELQLASTLQKTFLPTALPKIDGCCTEVLYRPSVYIGGDFYDFLPIDSKRWGILIADVKGHGVASAMLTATMKDNLYQLERYWSSPQALLSALNQQLYHFFLNTQNDFFITAFYGIVDMEKQQLHYSNAGHCPPGLVSDGHLLHLDSPGGLPLGTFADGGYEEQVLDFPPGAELFLYTDGIFELPLYGESHHHNLSLADLFGAAVFRPDMLTELKQEISTCIAHSDALPDDINYISIKRID